MEWRHVFQTEEIRQTRLSADCRKPLGERKNKTTKGPINGEQYFVEDSVRERLNLKLLPNAWFTRWMVDGTPGTMKRKEWKTNISSKYKKVSGNNYVYLGGEFHSDIKMVHFTHSMNKPHLWKDYEQHI